MILYYYYRHDKGYTGHFVYDDEAKLFHGEVVSIRDVITFQADNVADLKQALNHSVNDYLDFCKERNEDPAIPDPNERV